jgi:hypothetical protein
MVTPFRLKLFFFRHDIGFGHEDADFWKWLTNEAVL